MFGSSSKQGSQNVILVITYMRYHTLVILKIFKEVCMTQIVQYSFLFENSYTTHILEVIFYKPLFYDHFVQPCCFMMTNLSTVLICLTYQCSSNNGRKAQYENSEFVHFDSYKCELLSGTDLNHRCSPIYTISH